MVWIYGGLLLIPAVLSFLAAGRKIPVPKENGKQKSPFRLLYPAASLVLSWYRKSVPHRNQDRIRMMLKQVYLRENVEQELYLYSIRKTATLLAVVSGALLLGFLASLSALANSDIRKLERPDPGMESTHYELEAVYRAQEETVALDLEAVHYTESEILELFEWAYDGVVIELLGENSSREQVTEPLHLITQYQGFDIYWDIEDISSVRYDGEIRADLPEGESLLVNLYATFSLDGVSQIYSIPIRLIGSSPQEQDLLLLKIKEAVAQENSPYSKTVYLPEEIEGSRIRFHSGERKQTILFLVLALCSFIAVLLFYDRSLEEKTRKRQSQMLSDFAEIVSKLRLLYDAGLSIHSAFERIVKDQAEKKEERFAYREMQLALEKIGSGVSEADAYAQFGRRCGLYPYIKLGNLLEQNLSKGTRGMQILLQQEVEASFEDRKRLARKKGEEAGTRMLIPMILMLLVVIAVIALPALMSIGI